MGPRNYSFSNFRSFDRRCKKLFEVAIDRAVNMLKQVSNLWFDSAKRKPQLLCQRSDDNAAVLRRLWPHVNVQYSAFVAQKPIKLCGTASHFCRVCRVARKRFSGNFRGRKRHCSYWSISNGKVNQSFTKVEKFSPSRVFQFTLLFGYCNTRSQTCRGWGNLDWFQWSASTGF